MRTESTMQDGECAWIEAIVKAETGVLCMSIEMCVGIFMYLQAHNCPNELASKEEW